MIKHIRILEKRFQAAFTDYMSYSLQSMLVSLALLIFTMTFSRGAYIVLGEIDISALPFAICFLLILSLFSSFLCMFMIPMIYFKYISIKGFIIYFPTISTWIIIIASVLIKIFLISIFEKKHNGYSKGGRKAGIRFVDESGKQCSMKQLYIRNLILFTGGLFTCCIVCMLPSFDGTGRSLIDSVLKIKIIEDDDNWNGFKFKLK